MSIFNIRYVGKLQKPQRIEALTDGTLAIVMTILVLELALESGSGNLAEKLAHMGPEIYQYFMTFIAIGGAWMMHYYQFYYIRRVDSISMWLNILFLATVALIPFSYGLMLTNYGENTADQHTAMLFFAGNLLVMTLLLLIHWLYATYKHHLVDKDILHEKVSIMRNILLFGTIYPLIVIGLSFVQFGVSQTLFGILSLLYLALVILLGLHFGKVKEKEAT
jgi:uncharacterized membrane protein